MAGFAITNEFLLSTATVMIGATSALKSLEPAAHSIGLVKNFKLASDPKLIELTQGVLNDVVATTKTDLGLKCSWEMYEYTAKNLAYAAGLDATTGYTAYSTAYAIEAATLSATSVVIDGADHTTDFPAGAWIYIQKGSDDYVHVAKVASSAFATDTTITITGYGLPWAVSAGEATVGRLNKLDVGLNNTDNTLAMKVVGLLPASGKPITLMFPKIKITKGLDFSFQTNDYANLPMEATPYRPLVGNSFYSADFSTAVSVLRQ